MVTGKFTKKIFYHALTKFDQMLDTKPEASTWSSYAVFPCLLALSNGFNLHALVEDRFSICRHSQSFLCEPYPFLYSLSDPPHPRLISLSLWSKPDDHEDILIIRKRW